MLHSQVYFSVYYSHFKLTLALYQCVWVWLYHHYACVTNCFLHCASIVKITDYSKVEMQFHFNHKIISDGIRMGEYLMCCGIV